MDTGFMFLIVVLNAAWALLMWLSTRADQHAMMRMAEALSETRDDATRALHDVRQLAFVVRLQQDQLNEHARAANDRGAM